MPVTSGNIQSVTARVRDRIMLGARGKTISELHKADYRTVLRRIKAGNREVSVLSVEEEIWENRKG